MFPRQGHIGTADKHCNVPLMQSSGSKWDSYQLLIDIWWLAVQAIFLNVICSCMTG